MKKYKRRNIYTAPGFNSVDKKDIEYVRTNMDTMKQLDIAFHLGINAMTVAKIKREINKRK